MSENQVTLAYSPVPERTAQLDFCGLFFGYFVCSFVSVLGKPKSQVLPTMRGTLGL